MPVETMRPRRVLSSNPEAVRSRERYARARAARAEGTTRASSDAVRQRHRSDAHRARNADAERRRRARRQSGEGFTLDDIATHRPAPLRTPWCINPCEWCGALLLHSDAKTWCCKSGQYVLDPLPPLPNHINSLLESQPAGMNEQSRQLNYLFCLSAIGVTEQWTKYQGLHALSISVLNAAMCNEIHNFLFPGGGPYWLAMQGKTYHRMFPTERADHPAHWFLYDATARSQKAAQQHVPQIMLECVRFDIEENNPLYHAYRSFADYRREEQHAYMELELADAGSGHEIAALYHVGNSPMPSPRKVYIQRASDITPARINILHPLYEPLQYPLLFPHGTEGWGIHLKESDPRWTQREYYKHRLLTETRFQALGRLGCEYMCDMFSRMEDERLDFVRKGKAAEADLFGDNEDDADDDTVPFTLPASFTGSPKYYADRTADALALSRQRGKPDLMVTATCNPNWPEIRSRLLPGQGATEIPHITNRVFKVSNLPIALPVPSRTLNICPFEARLAKLLAEIKSIFGVNYFVYVIEFQKRGLPHAHIVLKVRSISSCTNCTNNIPSCVANSKSIKSTPSSRHASPPSPASCASWSLHI
jgi:hypothetical protein